MVLPRVETEEIMGKSNHETGLACAVAKYWNKQPDPKHQENIEVQYGIQMNSMCV